MIKPLVLLIAIGATLTAHAGLRYENLDDAAVGRCLAPLSQSADAATARACVRSLNSLSGVQPTAENAAIFQLSCLITNLLDAETTLLRARQDIFTAEKEARSAEANAREWMKPNVFGHTNSTLYSNSRNDGQSIRQQAAARRQNAQASYDRLIGVARETVSGLRQSGRTRISEPLSAAVNAIASRTGKSLPAETDQTIGTIAGIAVVAGLLWAGSKLLDGSGSSIGSDDQAELNRQMQMNEQIRRNRERDEARERAESDARERAAIEAQHARWREESMRPFN